MEALAVIGSVMSAVQSMQQGAAAKSAAQVQSAQAVAEGESRALEYEMRANQTLDQLRRNIASNTTQGYAGGVVGLDGSTALVNTISSTDAGNDLMYDYMNAKNAVLGGNVQGGIYTAAGKAAYQGGILGSAAKLAEAGYEYSKIGSAPEATG